MLSPYKSLLRVEKYIVFIVVVFVMVFFVVVFFVVVVFVMVVFVVFMFAVVVFIVFVVKKSSFRIQGMAQRQQRTATAPPPAFSPTMCSMLDHQDRNFLSWETILFTLKPKCLQKPKKYSKP